MTLTWAIVVFLGFSFSLFVWIKFGIKSYKSKK